MTGSLARAVAIATTALIAATLVVAAPAHALGRDTDKDGMPDKWEKRYNLDWRKPNAKGDKDRDGISNLREFRLGLNPRQPDAQCSELQKALGATDPSECGSMTITQLLR
jgi:hypothetical protein